MFDAEFTKPTAPKYLLCKLGEDEKDDAPRMLRLLKDKNPF